MKNNLIYIILSLLLVGLLTQGFQCGSPEFTGAKVQEQQKNYPEAVRLYEKELQKNPNNQEAWFNLGRIRGTQLNDYAGMNQAFKEAAKISPKFATEINAYRNQYWVQHINAGVSFAKRANKDSVQYYDKAIEQYNTAAAIWPDTSLTYHYMALTYIGKGDVDGALASQKKSWDLDHDKEQYKQIGAEVLKEGLKKKEEFKTENADFLKFQTNLKDIDKGTNKSTVTRTFGPPDSQKKDKKNPKIEEWIYNKYATSIFIEGDKVSGKKSGFKIDSSKCREANKQFDKAVDVFESVKTAYPKDNENLNMLLQAYYEAGRTVEATKTFKLAVENEPGNKMNHYILGLLYRTVDDYDGAITEFSEALKIDPGFTDAMFDIGATYYNWGVKIKKAAQDKGNESTEYKAKFQDALPWMEKVSKINKDDLKVWDSLGTIYALLGQSQKATKALDEADRIRKTAK
jgi:tetratricopeptide (TPR) repeat protein